MTTHINDTALSMTRMNMSVVTDPLDSVDLSAIPRQDGFLDGCKVELFWYFLSTISANYHVSGFHCFECYSFVLDIIAVS